MSAPDLHRTGIADALATLRRRSAETILIDGPGDLAGSVAVQGSKNAALKVLPALAGFPAVFRIHRIPLVIDTLELLSLLQYLGARVSTTEVPTSFEVDTRPIENRPIPYALTHTTTAAFCFAGALLGRFGEVQIGRPGGDDIGRRPVDVHTDAFRDLGARVEEDAEWVRAWLPRPPRDTSITLRLPSAGATVNAVLVAAASRGSARIHNAPRDSDMTAFYRFLASCHGGIRWDAAGVDILISDGPSPQAPIAFRCPSDRNDAFTWLAAGALGTGGVHVTDVDLADLRPGLTALTRLGVEVESTGPASVRTRRPSAGLTIPGDLVIEAGPSPAFHSDWAPLLQLVMTSARGRGRTVDTLYERRVRQAEILRQMGADIHVLGGRPPAGITVHFRTPVSDARYIVEVRGPAALHAVTAAVGNDVRACATAVLAATTATGASELSEVGALYRGYSDVAARLRSLGAEFRSIPERSGTATGTP